MTEGTKKLISQEGIEEEQKKWRKKGKGKKMYI